MYSSRINGGYRMFNPSVISNAGDKVCNAVYLNPVAYNKIAPPKHNLAK